MNCFFSFNPMWLKCERARAHSLVFTFMQIRAQFCLFAISRRCRRRRFIICTRFHDFSCIVFAGGLLVNECGCVFVSLFASAFLLSFYVLLLVSLPPSLTLSLYVYIYNICVFFDCGNSPNENIPFTRHCYWHFVYVRFVNVYILLVIVCYFDICKMLLMMMLMMMNFVRSLFVYGWMCVWVNICGRCMWYVASVAVVVVVVASSAVVVMVVMVWYDVMWFSSVPHPLKIHNSSTILFQIIVNSID